jgi:putative PEP-CTERM system histidine kinase
MLGTVTLWGHALAALLFAVVALSQARRAADALPRFAFTIALGLTALFALTVAGIGATDISARIAESLRDFGWLAFMIALLRRDRSGQAAAAASVYGVVAVIVAAATVLDMAVPSALTPVAPGIVAAADVLRMIAAVSALVLVRHLYTAVRPDARDGIRLVVAAMAVMWGVDLVLYADAYLGGAWPDEMIAVRGITLAVLAPVFALAVHRNGDWSLRLSRTVAYQSLSLAGLALYVLAMVLATSLIATIAGAEARLIQTAFVFGTTAALLTILSTPWLAAWIKVKLAKHVFRHRYDYRAEWVRFTETLGLPGDAAAPLEQRIVKAVADVTDSPAGMLLVADGSGLGLGATWNWDPEALPGSGGDEALAAWLGDSGRIIELDPLRAATADPAERAAIPFWILDRPSAWVIVPLNHFGKLAGVILLARPPVDRRLDWEDFDLLKIVGSQVASYLAEARSHAALADARRFDEFNRRFAFIIHDIKNLVSQLTLVARNAERHAENPAFRADMVATLNESAIRMTALLARLSQQQGGRPDRLVPVEIGSVLLALAGSRRLQHPIAAVGVCSAPALADPGLLDQLLGHLIQNAIEASPPDQVVTLAMGEEPGHVTIDVIDRGCGMSPAFVRDQLFRPFVSSKPGGFGLGAYEARQLAQAMGGSLAVSSREGEGTRFRLTLPAAAASDRHHFGKAA